MAKIIDIFSKYSPFNVFSSSQKYFKKSDHHIELVIFCEIVLKFWSQVKEKRHTQLLYSNLLFFNNQFWLQ